MKKLIELRKKIQVAKARHHQFSNDVTPAVAREMSDEIKALTTEYLKTITEGAEPCPTCGASVIGIEHQTKKGQEYEIGCPVCKPFEHEDGTWRMHAARGGVLPHHTVELWNAGPNFWMKVPAPKGAA